MMEVTIEAQDVRAVYFYSRVLDDAELLAEAAKFLEGLKGHGGVRILLGMNYQSDEFGKHLTLFLEKRFIPPSQPPYDTPKEVKIRYL